MSTSTPEPTGLPTAFTGTARALRERCAGASLRHESFARPLARCDLSRCRGTCCTHGVTLNAEEALVLTRLVTRDGAALRRLVPDLPTEPVVRDGDGIPRTQLKPRAFRDVVSEYPAHFPETACAFLGPTARCALQELAAERGEAPWAYKPLACWLHPIALSADEILLPDAATDPHAGGFASQTHCGRSPACGGAPASEVLAPELACLGGWLGRDLPGELAAAAAGAVRHAPPAPGTAHD
jgi:hypothetical protein